MNDAQASELFDRYFDGDLAEGEIDSFRHLLVNDRDQLSEFCSRADFEARLMRESTDLGQLKMPETMSTKRIWLTSMSVAATVTLLLVLVLWLVAIQRPEVLASYEVSPQGVVQISGGSEEALTVGSTVTVSQGRARLKLSNGVVSVIQAPASLKLISEGEVSLSGGLASFTVPPGAVGFKVKTTSLEVTDLGTVFGIDDTRDQQSEVHVFEGLVEAKLRDTDQTVSRLKKGEALGVNPLGLLSRIPIDQKRFPVELGRGLPAVRFSFDHFEDNTTLGEGSLARRYRIHLTLGENAPKISPGKFGDALTFSGSSRFAQSNWFGISGRSPRTISLWFRASQEGLPNPLLCWGLRDGSDRMSNLGLRLSKSGRVRLVSGKRWLEGSSKLDDGKWHHLVVVMSDFYQGAWPKTQIFVDGARERVTARVPQGQEPAPLRTYYTVTDEPGSSPLTLGSFHPDKKAPIPQSNWNLHGQLDELIFVEGVINEDQIKALFRRDWAASGLDLEKK